MSSGAQLPPLVRTNAYGGIGPQAEPSPEPRAEPSPRTLAGSYGTANNLPTIMRTPGGLPGPTRPKRKTNNRTRRSRSTRKSRRSRR